MLPQRLSHRERVRLALEHKVTDRVPVAFVCSGVNQPARPGLEHYLRSHRSIVIDEYLRPILDIQMIGAEYVGPPLAPRQDIWGVIRKEVSYGSGSYNEIDHYPLGEAADIDDVLRHRWPSTDWFDYKCIPEQIRRINADEQFCILGPNSNPFESTWYMRGFQRTLTDLMLKPELIDCILQKVTEFFLAHGRKILQAADGQIDLMFTADDIGGQTGLLMSPKLWRRHIMPHHRAINEMIHSFGAKVIYHSDGSVMDAVGGLVEMGIDVLQALQFDAAGMDPAALKYKYGDRLCFQGGISVQKTLPFGTAEDVRRETAERIGVLGAGGGYILGPSHAIQAGTPPQNIVAMFETALSTPMNP